MTNIQTSEREARKVNALRAWSLKAERVGHELAKHRNAQAKVLKRAKVANSAIGAFALVFGFVALVPSVKVLLGDFIPLVIAIIGAVFLFADAYMPSILEDPNPQRFGDYAHYILKYSRDLDALADNVVLPPVEWDARADLLMDWTRANLDDAIKEWPWLIGVVSMPSTTAQQGIPADAPQAALR
jgi:hypothetical protein